MDIEVKSDPEMALEEQEVSINILRGGDLLDIYASIPSFVRNLLKHDHFEPDWIVVKSAESVSKVRSLPHAGNTEGSICAVKGKLPIGAMKLSETVRQTNHISQVF